jgi:monoamine oxidase
MPSILGGLPEHQIMSITLNRISKKLRCTRRMSTQSNYDCVIIGAGWAGAVAARDLTAKGHSVVIVEARDRVGGRASTWTSKQNKDVKVDVGCSWIHGYKEGNPARAIAKELGVVSGIPGGTVETDMRTGSALAKACGGRHLRTRW